MTKTKARAKGHEISEALEELLYQALETELGGVEVYRAALKCVENEDLREEWTKYLDHTQQHVIMLTDLCRSLGLDPDADTPGRQVVRTIGKALVQAMMLALGNDKRDAAERVAAECVVLAETKDHLNWSLLGELVRGSSEPHAELIAEAHAEVEPEEDEHLYHTQGWTRELWLKALGLPAQLPPPEEEQDVESAVEAASAKKSRKRE
jgi:rubrerythrin